MLYPLKIKPVYKEYIWGGRRLAEMGREIPEGRIAESWEISAHAAGPGTVENGRFKGRNFPEMLKLYGTEIMGTRLHGTYSDFPLLLKLIDANRQLSVQVHPTDRYASEQEGYPYGKSEMWHILSAKPNADIIFGTKPGTDRTCFKNAIDTGTVTQLLNPVRVKKGDTIYIPAGKVHALNDGLLVAEIQQNSNLTYRIHDYGRKDSRGMSRELHIDKALDVIDFGHPDARSIPGKCNGLQIEDGTCGTDSITCLAAGRYFCVDLCTIKGNRYEDTKGEKFLIYLMLEGAGTVTVRNEASGLPEHSAGSAAVHAGETVLLPALPGKYLLEGDGNGDMKLLRVYVPCTREEAFEPLLRSGHTLGAIYESIGGACDWDQR